MNDYSSAMYEFTSIEVFLPPLICSFDQYVEYSVHLGMIWFYPEYGREH